MLFNPKLAGLNLPGIHQTCFDTVMKCDNDVRRDLFSSIVLSGGTTLIDGIAKRLLNEMTQLVPATNKV